MVILIKGGIRFWKGPQEHLAQRSSILTAHWDLLGGLQNASITLALPHQPWPGSLLQASSKESDNYPHLRTTIPGHLSYSTGQEIETDRESFTYAKCYTQRRTSLLSQDKAINKWKAHGRGSGNGWSCCGGREPCALSRYCFLGGTYSVTECSSHP